MSTAFSEPSILLVLARLDSRRGVYTERRQFLRAAQVEDTTLGLRPIPRSCRSTLTLPTAKSAKALSAIASAHKDSAALAEARSHLLKAQENLINLRRRNELGKNYEHKLTLDGTGQDDGSRWKVNTNASFCRQPES